MFSNVFPFSLSKTTISPVPLGPTLSTVRECSRFVIHWENGSNQVRELWTSHPQILQGVHIVPILHASPLFNTGGKSCPVKCQQPFPCVIDSTLSYLVFVLHLCLYSYIISFTPSIRSLLIVYKHSLVRGLISGSLRV